MKQVTGPDGNAYDTVPVEVMESTERWCEYTLSDGSVVKVKPVLTEISLVVGQQDPFGNPVYVISAQPVVAVSGRDKPVKRKS